MGFFDWNGNGKDDLFDTFMDYQVCKSMFEDDEETYDYDGNTDILYSDYDGSNCQTTHKDIYGIKEIAGKSTENILRILISRKNRMVRYYETCSIESGFREAFDNRQMIEDFWLYNIAKILDLSRLQKNQKIKLLQLLLNTFNVNNGMTAELHYSSISCNDKYQKYMNHCFGIDTDNCALFWRLLAIMSADDRIRLTVEFTKEHIKFMYQLEVYLSSIFQNWGFGDKIQSYIKNLLDYIAEGKEYDIEKIARHMDYIINPLYPTFYK